LSFSKQVGSWLYHLVNIDNEEHRAQNTTLWYPTCEWWHLDSVPFTITFSLILYESESFRPVLVITN
jgi:hypothetical protein